MIETIIQTCVNVVTIMREHVLFAFSGIEFTVFNISCAFLVLNILFNLFFGGSEDD